MCSFSFRSPISLSSFTFAVFAWLLAQFELKNVSFDPLTIRICRLHHRFSPSVSSLPSTTFSAAFFAALTALAVRILSVIRLVSRNPLRFSSWCHGPSVWRVKRVVASFSSAGFFNLFLLNLASRFFRRQPHQEHGHALRFSARITVARRSIFCIIRYSSLKLFFHHQAPM